MRTVHIEGWAERIDIQEKFSEESRITSKVHFRFEDETDEVIPNIFLRIYESEEKCSLEMATEGFLQKMFGSLELSGEAYGYSEYTIEGYHINEAKLGGHDIQDIIDSKKGKYLHILIDQVDLKKKS
jgi:hypothetical protein